MDHLFAQTLTFFTGVPNYITKCWTLEGLAEAHNLQELSDRILENKYVCNQSCAY